MQIIFFKTSIWQAEIDAVVGVMKTWMVVEWQEVRKLENDFNNYSCNWRYFPIAVSNWTVALDLALKVLNIQEGDEVIVPDFTFIATANSVRFQKAKVVFADVDLRNYNINLNDIKEKVTEKTKAIIVVHLFWNPIKNIKEIVNFADEKWIKVIEDCAQAHWAEIDGKRIWSFWWASCFSFYATKNMWCWEWWMTLFKDEIDYKKWKLIYNHWQSEKYLHTELWYNFRLTNIAAAIWNTQLAKLDELNSKRIYAANIYNEILSSQNILQLPIVNGWIKHVYHQYTVLLKKDSGINREELIGKLKDKWVPTAIHYPFPVHMQPYYQNLWYSEDVYPNSMYLSKNIFSLPVYPWLRKEEIEYVANTILSLI